MVRGEQLRDGAEEVPLVLYCLIDGCVQAERLQLLHSMPDVSSALPLLATAATLVQHGSLTLVSEMLAGMRTTVRGFCG